MKKLLFLVLVLVLTATLNSCKEPIENYEDGKEQMQQRREINHDEVGDNVDDDQQEGNG